MDWGVTGGWGEDALGNYPTLPKSFTNAKTAKKRKHKELFVTEEDLLKPVRLGKPSASPGGKEAFKHSGKQQAASKQPPDGKGKAAETGAGAGAKVKTEKPKKEKHKEKERGKQQQQEQKQERHKQKPAHADAEQQQPAAAAALAVLGNDDEPPRKKSKNKFKQEAAAPVQQQQVAVDAAAVGADGGGGKPKKKSKNKFKQDGDETAQTAKQSKPPPQQAQQQQQSKKQKQQQQQQQQQEEEDSKKVKQRKAGQEHDEKQQQQQPNPQQQPAARGSKLLDKMRARLQGGRFRQLNEALYTQPGADAFDMMKSDPVLFQQYHDGFKEQVRHWPLQPQDAAIRWVGGLPKGAVVADFGCGDARLAASVKQRVHSLDLVASAPGVIACNMAATPLAAASCDAAVFSLSLMGTDYPEFLVEARRVLKPGGWLWIAEVRSRFTPVEGGAEDFRPFIKALAKLGFKVSQQDTSNRMFVTMLFRKDGDGDAAEIKWPPLRACVYKKR